MVASYGKRKLHEYSEEPYQIVQPMNPLRKIMWGVAGIAALALLFLGFCMFTGEPTYHFKSVTQWLNRMALFDEMRNMEKEGRNGYKLPHAPEVVTNDPALRALLAIGAKAVPTLEKILNEQPESPAPEPMDRVKSWSAQIWQQVQGAGAPPAAPPPVNFGSVQQARMAAAGLAMLALGTNNQAGALRVMEIEAARQPKIWSGAMLASFAVGNAGLPDQHKEIVAGIIAGLNHTNTQVQELACVAAWHSPSDFPIWKDKLMQLAQGSDAGVARAALHSLINAGKHDEKIIDLCGKLLANNTNAPSVRYAAATGLGFAGESAEGSLPLLLTVLGEQGITKDGLLIFSGKDVVDLPKLVSRLVGQGDPASALIWERLTTSEQSMLRNYRPSGPTAIQTQDVVVRVLQKTIKGPSIYKADRFSDFSLRAETLELIRRNPSGLTAAFLNRLLLEDAFPQELAPHGYDLNLQRATTFAMESIEKAVAARDGKGKSTPIEK